MRIFKYGHKIVGFSAIVSVILMAGSVGFFAAGNAATIGVETAFNNIGTEEITKNLAFLTRQPVWQQMQDPEPADLALSGYNMISVQQAVFTERVNGRLRSDILTYRVKPGDTLSALSRKFDVTSDTIAWANNLKYADDLRRGQKLIILPITGVLHTVKGGETVKSIAKKYHAKTNPIVSFNDLETRPLERGMKLIVPDGYKLIKIGPRPVVPQYNYSNWGTSTWSNVKYLGTFPYQSGNFAGGYCTSYAQWRKGSIPWSGDAKEWAHNASAAGYPVGGSAKVGAIYVEPWLTWSGHVSIVTKLNSDGSFYIREGNARYGYGTMDQRLVPAGRGGSFIYYKLGTV